MLFSSIFMDSESTSRNRGLEKASFRVARHCCLAIPTHFIRRARGLVLDGWPSRFPLSSFQGALPRRSRVGCRRWGWVCSQPRVLGQAESSSACEGFRTGLWSLRRRRPLARGLRPLVSRAPEAPHPTRCSPRRLRQVAGPVAAGMWMLRIRGRYASSFCSFSKLCHPCANSRRHGSIRGRPGSAPGDCARCTRIRGTEICTGVER